MKRSAPMKRTGFARKLGSPFSSLANRGTALRRTAMKKRAKKPTVAEGSKYLAACRGEPCYLRVPGVCRRNPNDETVVPCHENSLAAGKGMGLKANHARTVPGCYWCHVWLDQGPAPRAEKQSVFLPAFDEWAPVRARKMGLQEVIA
ncbi:nuclease domain-containing protein [Paraburkholderia sp. JHI2823]|uniref:nuclease domain-containing protein n=1 Tax=Paraburkholderia sp. JHI2823 TaxID=3112960 RepID=UPI00316EDEAE